MKLAGIKCPGCRLLWGAIVVGWFAAGALRAEDDLDQQLLESLEGSRTPDSPVTVVNRLLDNTESARERLAAGQLDEQTTSIQQQILDDIDALLKQTGVSPPAGSPPPPSGNPSSQPDGGEGSPQSGTQQEEQSVGDSATERNGRPGNDPNAASRESAERTTPGEETETERARRLGLATAAWGHLPPKVREQMRSAFSETYLPEYDELVRRYYEALAARRERREAPAIPRSP